MALHVRVLTSKLQFSLNMNVASGISSCVKHKTGKPLRSVMKNTVLNEFDTLYRELRQIKVNNFIPPQSTKYCGATIGSVRCAYYGYGLLPCIAISALEGSS